MNMETTIVAAPERLTSLAELLKRFERDDMERAVDLLIAMIDAADGDIEAEPATFTEAGSRHTAVAFTDDHEAAGDEGDVAWAEWLSRGRHKLYAGGYEALSANRRFGNVREDDEDDDAREPDDPRDVAHRENVDQTALHDWTSEDTEEDDHSMDPLDAGELTTVERERQPDYPTGYDDDLEPLLGPTTLNLDAANEA